jgi:NADH-quinone oxidoreductase subunit B
MLLQQVVGGEKRPLSWVGGPQGVVKAGKTSMRETKRTVRVGEGFLAPPDGI